MTQNVMSSTFLLPAPLASRGTTDVVYYQMDVEADSALVRAFDDEAHELAKAEAKHDGHGRFEIVCRRGSEKVTIIINVDRDASAVYGEIDGKRFRIASETDAGDITLTAAQRNVMKPWNPMGESFVVLGEAMALHSPTESVLGCVAAGLGTGVAAAACLEGALPACAAGLYGVAYLADHCI